MLRHYCENSTRNLEDTYIHGPEDKVFPVLSPESESGFKIMVILFNSPHSLLLRLVKGKKDGGTDTGKRRGCRSYYPLCQAS